MAETKGFLSQLKEVWLFFAIKQNKKQLNLLNYLKVLVSKKTPEPNEDQEVIFFQKKLFMELTFFEFVLWNDPNVG